MKKPLQLLTIFVVCVYSTLLFAQSERAGWINEPIHPIPLRSDSDSPMLRLGRSLFNDPRLSADNSVSCASCHPVASGGMDSKRYSNGIRGATLDINTPSVLNAGFNFLQFWDGRAIDLETQVRFPIHAEREMGSNWRQVIDKLSRDAEYSQQFVELFPDRGIAAETISSAIAEYQRSLTTPNSRFDQFLRGDSVAISDLEQQGYLLFKRYGCSSCHQGVNVGGNMFERMGLMRDYFAERGNITAVDYGRFNVTGDEAHRYQFKVPSLRNVALTAPYFHDGTAASLEEAVNVMAKYQLGRRLPQADVTAIVAFLHTLTGELPE